MTESQEQITPDAGKPASQQDSAPAYQPFTEEELKKMAETPHPEAPPPHPVDDMEAKCLTIFHLTEGRKYQNNISLPPSQIEAVRQGMLKSIEGQKENSLVSIQGSKNSPIDFCIIPVKNIIFFELRVLEIVKRKPSPNAQA